MMTQNRLLMTTTSNVEGHPVKSYLGIVTAETILGANAMRDFMASFSDFFGGRSSTYEEVLLKGKNMALDELSQRAERLGANAVIGVDIDYETVGKNGSMLMVVCSGTAVVI